MDITTVVSFAEELRKRLDALERLKSQIDADLEKTQKTIGDRLQSHDASIKNDIQKYIK